jgi:hypothetical protein
MIGLELDGADRRQSKRYDYLGKVDLLCTETGLSHSGLLLNVSMGGCLLKLAAPEDSKALRAKDQPRSRERADSQLASALGAFERDMVVEALFQLGYLPFFATGSVKRCDRESCLIGLAFLGLSKFGRGDLEKLFCNLEAVPN